MLKLRWRNRVALAQNLKLTNSWRDSIKSKRAAAISSYADDVDLITKLIIKLKIMKFVSSHPITLDTMIATQVHLTLSLILLDEAAQVYVCDGRQ